MKLKFKVIGSITLILIIILGFLYFKYFFTYEQKNVLQRRIDTITGQNLTITIFGFDGRIVKRWTGVQKITAGRQRDISGERNYTYFYTRENKYVQIPDSVWYIAEEE